MSGKKLDSAYAIEKDGRGAWVDPTEIVIGTNFARRNEEPKSKEETLARAASIYHDGQQTAAVVRKVADKLHLVAGFGRAAAVNLIRGGFEWQGETLKDADRKLYVTVDDTIKTDADARKAAVLENVRKDVSPINVAQAQAELRDLDGLNDTEIARLYGYNNTNSVAANRKLLDLPADQQKLVHTGKLSRDAAVKLQQLPEDKQAEVIAEAKEGKVTTAVVTEKIAEHREKAEGAGGGGGDTPRAPKTAKAPGEGGSQYAPRNAAALKKFIAEDVIGNEDIPTGVQAIFIAVQKFLEGKNTGKTILNRIAEVNV